MLFIGLLIHTLKMSHTDDRMQRVMLHSALSTDNSTKQYNTNIVLYCIVLYCIVLYCIVLVPSDTAATDITK